MSMFRAERKKSVGCEMSKNNGREMESIAIYAKSAINMQPTYGENERGTTNLFISVLLDTRSNSARLIMEV